jgi:signal transduction histidine kinase
MRSKPSGASAIVSSVSSRIAHATRAVFRLADLLGRRASLTRATVETAILAIFWAMLYQALNEFPTDESTVAFATIVASAVFLGAFRLSPSRGIVSGIERELTAMILIIGTASAVQLWIGVQIYSESLRSIYAPFIVLLADVAVFVVGRFLVVVLPWWRQLQRRKLRWQLVQAQINVVFLLLIVPIGIALYAGSRYLSVRLAPADGNTVENIVLRVAYRVIPALALIVVLFGLALILVIPPSIAVSYFFAKRMTRRLEQLTTATTSIREGDYSARIVARGLDEIAALQRNFNVMAAVLEASIEEAAEERDKIARLLEQRRELVASVSHELRTPLAIIRGYLDSTLAQRGQLDPALERDLGVMHGEALRLQRLIDDLFALSRAEVGSLSLQTRETNIGRLLQRCVDATGPAAWRSQRVEVLLDASPDLPTLAIDADRLEQIVLNLISNAVRHSPPGGLVHIEAARDLDVLRIDVADTGEGIPPEEIEKIWNRFYRGSNTTDARGSGIGLAVVRELTEALGGEVSVTSRVGEGSRFRLRFSIDDDLPALPAKRESPAIAAGDPPPQPQPDRAPMASGRLRHS